MRYTSITFYCIKYIISIFASRSTLTAVQNGPHLDWLRTRTPCLGYGPYGSISPARCPGPILIQIGPIFLQTKFVLGQVAVSWLFRVFFSHMTPAWDPKQFLFQPTRRLIIKEKSGKRTPGGGIMEQIIWEAFEKHLGSIWEAFGRHLRSIWEHMGGNLADLSGRSG